MGVFSTLTVEAGQTLFLDIIMNFKGEHGLQSVLCSQSHEGDILTLDLLKHQPCKHNQGWFY